MEKIIIRIPDNLTPAQEVIAIAKKYAKLIGKEQKKLGVSFDIKQTTSQITIIRETKEKIYKTKECSVCNSVFAIKNGYKAFTNYGGLNRLLSYCSEECRDFSISENTRVSLKRLPTAFLIR